MNNHPNLKKLGEIATVRTGYTFREKVDEVDRSKGNAYLLQIKDIRRNWEAHSSSRIQTDDLADIFWTGKASNALQNDNIALPARGGFFRSAILKHNGNNERPIIASSQFLVITAGSAVLPEYLCWALNRPVTQHYLALGAGSQGTNIPMLNAASAKSIPISVPSIEKQHQILHLNALWEQEKQATHALLNNREKMLQGMYQKLLQEF